PGAVHVPTRIADLRRLGFRVAVDDLGSGYAGLNTFANLRPELVKLDQELVRGAHTDPLKERLVRSMTKVCAELGIVVVAEGIECDEELEAVRSYGCDLLQGYLLGMPRAEPSLPTILRSTDDPERSGARLSSNSRGGDL
ncbi:MAG: EAL domain-containing protein, partial [Myxococcales bacterium]|nr:EAL domain-containing protein [Myxococcales bacterium]